MPDTFIWWLADFSLVFLLSMTGVWTAANVRAARAQQRVR